jgi:hypothetical protein
VWNLPDFRVKGFHRPGMRYDPVFHTLPMSWACYLIAEYLERIRICTNQPGGTAVLTDVDLHPISQGCPSTSRLKRLGSQSLEYDNAVLDVNWWLGRNQETKSQQKLGSAAFSLRPGFGLTVLPHVNTSKIQNNIHD